MAKKVNDNFQVFSDVIVSLSQNATSQVEGIQIDTNNASKKASKDKGIHVSFLPNDKISIDVICDIYYGYAVSEVASLAQEKIIAAVEGATKYKVQSVNVHVNSVIVQ